MPVIFADTEATDRDFGSIVIKRYCRIGEEYLEIVLLILAIGESFSRFRIMWHFSLIRFYPCKESLHQWLYEELTLH
jgi:hypothetical protein